MKKILEKPLALLLGITLSVAFMPAFASAGTMKGLHPIGKIVESSYVKDGVTYKSKTLKYNDPSILTPKKTRNLVRRASTLPERYDLRQEGLITSAKDQGNYGSCWAFGSVGSAESNLIKKGIADTKIDLSERQLVYNVYNGKNYNSDKSLYAGKDTFRWFSFNYYDEGGFGIWQAGSSMARGYGLINEETSPYDEIQYGPSAEKEAIDKFKTDSVYSMTTANLLASPVNEDGTLNQTAMTTIKNQIVNNGAVDISYYYDEDCCPNDNTSYYYKGDEEANHEVLIAGWDDNYSASNFKDTPAGNGAWLIKNSWGTDFGDGGYCWLSYYNTSLTDPTEFLMQKTSDNDYDALYQYDGTGIGGIPYVGEAGLKYSGANFFKARKDTSLEKVGTWTTAANSVVDISIYKNPKSAKPTSGKLVRSSRGNAITFAGYHTIDIPDVQISKGDKFAVVVSIHYTNSDGNKVYLFPMEIIQSDYVSIDCSRGQSSINDGTGWVDIKDSYYASGAGNAIVKAYCDNSAAVGRTKITSLKAGKAKLAVTWKAATGATGYQIRIAKNARFTKGVKTYKVTSDTLSKLVTGLSKNKKYYVKIRGYKQGDTTTLYGKYSTSKKATVL